MNCKIDPQTGRQIHAHCYDCTAMALEWALDRLTESRAREEALRGMIGNGFVKDLMRLINYYSLESGSNTPDFILAEYMWDCLSTFGRWVRRREEWYGRDPEGAGKLAATKPSEGGL